MSGRYHHEAYGQGRWVQLILGVVAMALIANLQYSWTLFVDPMHVARGWSLTEIQWAFSIFIATQTWLTPASGAIVDRLGARTGPTLTIAAGGVMVGLGWVINAFAGSLFVLYLGAAVSGTGAGAIYATCVGNAVKWFPDRRGLAVGLTAAGYGAGAVLTIIPIRAAIASMGYASAFFWFGVGQATLLIVIAAVLRGPDSTQAMGRSFHVHQSASSATSTEVLRSPVFWVLYVMFVGVSASGLMVAAQIAPIAKDYGIANSTVFGGISTLSFALVVNNILNGLSRPFFGGVSDRHGREQTMAIAFALGAVSYGLLYVAGHNPYAFILAAGLVFFTWGEIFSLFPSTCTDIFGPKYATTNASMLYTAKGVSAFLVPLANVLQSWTGSWGTVFVVSALINAVVVALAVLVLRPARERRMVVYG